ncbi:MAG: Pr6Pr family membrane protein, partial [Clostridia bacterium]|nr:Pr6Pr family membrane protein [Clostridia bacterium]
LKCATVAAAATGTALTAAAAKTGAQAFMYFTIQSNIAIALICAAGAILLLARIPAGRAWQAVKYSGTVSITLTGAVFCFVLAPTMGAGAWTPANLLTHVAVPVCAIADFFVIGRYLTLRKRAVFTAAIPPVAYVVYASAGYILDWDFAYGRNYPYFFLNWGSPAGAFGLSGELPFIGCAWWLILLLGGILLTGYIYLAIVDRTRAAPREGESPGDYSGSRVKSFEKVTLRLSGMRNLTEYEIVMKDGTAEIASYGMRYENGTETRVPRSSTEADASEVLDLLNRCRLVSWDGFNGPHPKGLKDGTAFRLDASVNGGRRIHARGSQNFPKGYRELVDWLYRKTHG